MQLLQFSCVHFALILQTLSWQVVTSRHIIYLNKTIIIIYNKEKTALHVYHITLGWLDLINKKWKQNVAFKSKIEF